MKALVLVRQEIDIEGEVGRYSQLPNAKDYKLKKYKVSIGDNNDRRGIYYSNGNYWYLVPNIYFNDELKEWKETI
jgi:hypothetical protein